MRSSRTPAASSSSAVICRWVVEAGCRQQVCESATCVSMAATWSLLITASAAARPPLTPKLTTPHEPFGRYFCPSS